MNRALLQLFVLLQFAAVYLLPCHAAEKYINLEERSQDFVLETKRIHIPGYPDAFNPSIVKWLGKNLLSFRFRDKETGNADPLGLVWLDSDFEVKGKPQVL